VPLPFMSFWILSVMSEMLTSYYLLPACL
jgi:hypothetical protein